MISILQTIYQGGVPEDKSLPVNITENQITNNKKNKNNKYKKMNKKQVIRINENQLKQIVTESVKRVLKEAYPTMSQKDSDDISSLENNIFTDEYNPPQNNLSFGMIAKLIGDACSKLVDYDAAQAIDNDGNYEMEISYNNYLKSLEKHLKFCLSLCEKIVKQEIMLKGQQPDKYYDYKHSKNDEIKKHHKFWDLPRKNLAEFNVH